MVQELSWLRDPSRLISVFNGWCVNDLLRESPSILIMLCLAYYIDTSKMRLYVSYILLHRYISSGSF